MQKIISMALLIASIISYIFLSEVPTPQTGNIFSTITGTAMLQSYWIIPTTLIIFKFKDIKLKISYSLVLYCIYAITVTFLVVSIFNPASHWSTFALALSIVALATKEKQLEELYRNISLILLIFLLWEVVYLISQYWQMFTTHLSYNGLMGFILLMSFVLVGIWFNISYLHLIKKKWNIYWPTVIPILIVSLLTSIYWVSNWYPYTWDASSSSWNISGFNHNVWMVQKISKVVLLLGALWIK